MSPSDDSDPQPRAVPVARVALWLALALVIALYQLHLGAPGLWGDEADTGNFARSVLRSGLPRALSAAPGNPLVYGDCVQLGEGFLSRRLPWAQYYVGAASLSLFGDHPAGLRRLFALLGALALLPLAALLRRRTSSPLTATLVATLCCLHPQVLLLCRQARYFPLLVLLAAIMLWLVLEAPAARWRRPLLGLVTLLLCHSHPLAALALLLALAGGAALWRRERLLEVLLCAALGLASYAAFALLIPALPTQLPGHLDLLGRDPGRWLYKSGLAVLAHLRDLDYVGALPAAMAPLLVLAVARRERDPLVGTIALLCAAHVLLSAAAIGTEGTPRYAPLRYAAHLVPLLLLASYLALRSIRARWALPGFVAVLTLAPLSASYWYAGGGRRPLPMSHWPAVYAEVLSGAGDDWEVILTALRAPPAAPRRLLFVRPEGNNDALIYYLGDHVDLVPDVFPGSACAARLRGALGPPRWAALRRRPDEVLRFGVSDAAAGMPPGFTPQALTFPRGQPDGTRPELTRHVFRGQPESLLPVALWRAQPQR